MTRKSLHAALLTRTPRLAYKQGDVARNRDLESGLAGPPQPMNSEDKEKKDGEKRVIYAAAFILFMGAVFVGGIMYLNFSHGLLGIPASTESENNRHRLAAFPMRP
jgi:hypothetical protein